MNNNHGLLIGFFFLVFSCTFFAAESAEGAFENTYDPFHSNLEYSTDMICTLESGTSIDGSVCSEPATVCAGSEINVVPAAWGEWEYRYVESPEADQNLRLLYLRCGTRPCEVPEDFSGSRTTFTNDIHWLDESTYDRYDPDLGGFAQDDINYDIGLYEELDDFSRVRAVYFEDNEGVWFYDRAAYANVFCKGEIQVRLIGEDGGTRLGNSEISGDATVLGAPVSVTLENPGEYRIDTRIINAKCFAVATQIPVEEARRFLINFYGYNTPTVPPATTTTPTITVTEGICEMSYGGSRTGGTLEPGSAIGLTVTLDNTGDSPATATGVSSSTDGYTVMPMTSELCDLLGITFGLCPEETGFEIATEPGESRELFLYVSREEGSKDCLDNVCIDYECAAGGCGGGGSGSVCFDLCDAASCDIDPPSADIAENGEEEFDLACYDIGGEEIDCPGNDWSVSGFTADFLERSTTGAVISPTSGEGSSGTLDYSCGAGCSCDADIDIVESMLDCDIVPSGADLEEGESEDFDIECYYDDEPLDNDELDGADWSLDDGLDGDLDERGTDGATFTATTDSDGRLRVTVTYGDYVAVDSVPIRTGDFVEDEVPEDESSTEWCRITPGAAEGPTYSMLAFSIMCGPPEARVPCGSGTVSWDSSPLGVLDLLESEETDHQFKAVRITGEPEETAGLTAQVGGNPEHTCTAVVDVVEADCLEFT
jgi:hypothetical protein